MGIRQSAHVVAATAALGWLGFSLSPACAQFGFTSQFELSSTVQLSEPDSAARSHLARVGAFLADQQWDEAVETLRQVMQAHGDRVIALAGGRHVTVRDYCHGQIAALPVEALALYRARVDPLAERWYREALAAQDANKLQRLGDEFFASSWGDDALLALGDLALSAGKPARARDYWERISPLLRAADGRPLWLAARGAKTTADWESLQPVLTEREPPISWLAYRDSDLDLAAVRARLVLASLWEGSLRRAEVELAILEHLAPDASGVLAGREVNFVERLSDELAAARDWPQPPRHAQWNTFAGSPRRTTTLPPAVRIAGPAWDSHLKLGDQASADSTFSVGGRRIAEDADGLLSYHPIVQDDLLLLSDGDTIRAYNLHTGKPMWQGLNEQGVIYEPEIDHAHDSPRSRPGRLGVSRYTLTREGNLLFARLGNPITSRPPDPPGTTTPGYLVCLDLRRQGALLRKIEPDDDSWAFEGSPVSDGQYIYVAMRRSDVRPQAYVACFDARSGRRIWRKYVCAAETPARGQVVEVTNNLLTLSEDRIYYNTNLGTVASLRTSDGAVEWITVYPRAKRGDLSRRAAHFYRDLNPAVVEAGMVLVAPTDSEHILGLDAGTGQILWTSDLADDVVHLLGVAHDRLIASGDRVWWIDIRTGKVHRRFPEGKSEGPRGYGRGVLAGDELYWPTRDRIFVFDTQTTQPSQEPILLTPHGATGGNLLAIDGYLLIAASDTLYCFSQFPRRRHELQEAITRAPQEALPYFRLGQCEAAMKNWDEASRLFRAAIERASDQDRWRSEPLAAAARRHLQSSLRQQASVQMKAGQWEVATRLLDESAAVTSDPAGRLKTLLQAGDAARKVGRADVALGYYQKILAAPPLAARPVDVAADRSLAARLLVTQRVGDLLRQSGREPYAPYDAAARSAFETAQRARSTKPLEDLVAAYPHARVMPQALAALAVRYEEQDFPQLARHTWRRLARLAPQQPIASLPFAAAITQSAPETTVAAFVARHLNTLDDAARRPAVATGLPLETSWERVFPDEAGPPLVADSRPGSHLLLGTDRGVDALALSTGQTIWSLPLDSTPIWAARRGAQSLVATGSDIASQAAPPWRFSRERIAGSQGGFRQLTLVDNTIVAAVGRTHVVALDSTTGTLRWTYTHPELLVGSYIHAAGDYVALQLAEGNPQQAAGEGRLTGVHQTVVLDLASGQVQHTRKSATRWARPPIPWDERHLVTIYNDQWVEMFDLRRGIAQWSMRPAGVSPSLPADAVVADDTLLVFSGGRHVARIDPVDGAALWKSGVELGPQVIGYPSQYVAIDPTHQTLYAVNDGVLKAIDLPRGEPRWTTPLARSGHDRQTWRVRAFAGFVVAAPTEFEPLQPWRFSLVRAEDGQLAFRSRPFAAAAGPARLLVDDRRYIVVGPDRAWALNADKEHSTSSSSGTPRRLAP